MSSKEQTRVLSHSKAKRTANNNFQKRMKTLGGKFSELWQEYDAEIYFLAHRNGRFYTYSSIDKPSWPPSPETLDRLYPPPIKKSPAHFSRKKRGQIKPISHEAKRPDPNT
ncbi:hypothetical protein K469DRAFT_752116 [Zopfia rhizophila CBS 207.26]|uniref:MADS-box domain-containing protein n=1 Tax=Zopfia rhizophila CBS 207.26 TaxID=1314779 RepID=A0A6A6DWE1_9PEZI|nr:hypothetical protein K469DRAFT_752116 [Zopfia rhizophila CBS 207.26]